MLAASPPPRSRRLLMMLAIAIAAIVALSTVVGLWALHVGPFCSIPNGSTGTECYNGIEYQFETVTSPEYDHSTTFVFAGTTFVLWYDVDFSSGAAPMVVNATEASGANGSLHLEDGLLEETGWQTTISPDGHFGAQCWMDQVVQVRLLVQT